MIFNTEGNHLIQAVYNNVCPYGTSSGNLVQVVNNHTTVNGNTFCNDLGPVTINDNVTATPYPSNIFVSGLGTQIQKLTLSLKGFTHNLTSDVDILLVSPQGGKLVLMSGAGNGSASGINLTFDDAAASQLPQFGALTSGTYKPTAFAPAALFPAPAPAGITYAAPAGSGTLGLFNNTNPNGVWSLYVVDHATGNVGSIGGWCLTITTTITCIITPPVVAPVNNDPGQCGAIVNYPAAITSGNCGTLSYSQASGTFFPIGTTKVTIHSTTGQTASFDVTVMDAEVPQFTASCPGNQTVNTAPGQCSSVPVSFGTTASDNCPGVQVKYYLNYGLGNQQEISSPYSFQKGTTTVTVKAVDAAGNLSSTPCSFTVTVTDNADPTITAPPPVNRTAVGSSCTVYISDADLGS
ncbi:MAG TPA: HYR domain-containing protein, partial [Flavisolibacter sp.]|nr:HYR domain-containing protein [Flavisolibacter sp.]